MEVKCEGREPWLRGSIRRKLTLFVVLLCLTLVGLFWFFSVFLLQPAYNNILHRDLLQSLSAVVTVINQAEAEGVPLLEEWVFFLGSETTLSSEVTARLQSKIDNGTLKMDTHCLDISDENGQNVLLNDSIWPRCLLHPTYETGGVTKDGAVEMSVERNSELVQKIRSAVRQNGQYYGALDSGQMVVGTTVASGQLTVVFSANLERIPQAVTVLKKLLLPVSAILLMIGVMSAWIFSRWFTRPISRLSSATREMAKGNYDVSVAGSDGDDEFGALSRDFNTMAQEVKRSAELQKDLIANISHDLRTPLTLIKGYAETVRDLTGDDPERRTKQLSVIIDETDRLSALVNSVMELSRMSSGNEKPEPVLFDLSQLADEISYRYMAVCEQKGYTFDFRGEEGCDVVADPALVERALHNLLGNALNHIGEDGYIGLHVHKTAQNTTRVEVIDHGPGIAEEDKSHLFDRYYRSRSSEGRQGTGLGLSITKAIFEVSGFTYGIESTLGQGSTFWFEAPLVKQNKK